MKILEEVMRVVRKERGERARRLMREFCGRPAWCADRLKMNPSTVRNYWSKDKAPPKSFFKDLFIQTGWPHGFSELMAFHQDHVNVMDITPVGGSNFFEPDADSDGGVLTIHLLLKDLTPGYAIIDVFQEHQGYISGPVFDLKGKKVVGGVEPTAFSFVPSDSAQEAAKWIKDTFGSNFAHALKEAL